ncbi:MAG: hypothetical protein ACP5OP_08910 [Leptospirillia bacterium]
MSWSETAQVFRTSRDSVSRAVSILVDYGLTHLEGITPLGPDEIAVFRDHTVLTRVYPLNTGVLRLLWCGNDRAPGECMGHLRRKAVNAGPWEEIALSALARLFVRHRGATGRGEGFSKAVPP